MNRHGHGSGDGHFARNFLSLFASAAILLVGQISRAAPVYDITTIGFTDAEHTRDDGYRYSLPDELNAAGQATGYSDRYSGALSRGRTAWLYDGTSTLSIGLTDAEHTRNDGWQYSYPVELNAAGQATGYSYRYSGATDLGRTTWLYDGTTTLNVGLTGAEHTRNDGYRYSHPQALNALGQVCGLSLRYSGATGVGQTAWL